jgi:hypothetical protein
LSLGKKEFFMKVAAREVFIPSPEPGVCLTYTPVFYTHLTGSEMVSMHVYERRSDMIDVSYLRWSSDNGRTWSEPRTFKTYEKRPEGALQRVLMPGWLDPATGRQVFLILQGILPNDDPMDGMKRYGMRYAVSTDGGRSFLLEEPMVQEGSEFNEQHPIEGVWIGKNSLMNGVNALPRTNGEILYPVMVTPLGPDGEYYNPGGGYTYTDVVVMIGKWKQDRLTWRISERVAGDPNRSTRGMLEPTIAEFPGDRLLMVMRGSNDIKPELPGCKWYSVSTDGGRRWTAPEPWTYAGGEAFFSTSSISLFLTHSSGRTFWIGNITPENPKGGAPRYPLVMGQVDPESLMLMKETVTVIEDRRPGQSEHVQLSNFHAVEDRETGEIWVFVAPLFAVKQGDWTTDSYRYRIALEG